MSTNSVAAAAAAGGGGGGGGGGDRIHYGSLAASALRIAGNDASNINTTTTSNSIEISNAMDVDDQLGAFERRRAALRSLVVPTDPLIIRQTFRDMGEPVTLFGEGPSERRDRLRFLMADRASNGNASSNASGGGGGHGTTTTTTYEAQKKQNDHTLWYHEGSAELLEARFKMADYSLIRARKRLRVEQERRDSEESRRSDDARSLQEIHTRLRSVANYSSQVGDERPLSTCQFSPDDKHLATGSWSGICKVWSIPQCGQLYTLRGHTERVGCIQWHPTDDRTLVSCDAKGSVLLWSLGDGDGDVGVTSHAIGDFDGARVPRVAFHPSGRYIAATCWDHSWRLFDVETRVELLHQEGHSRPAFGVAFQCDGSLVATTSLDCVTRIWDVRSGKCVQPFQGHVKQVGCVDWHPGGHQLATGSDDHTVKAWDIRKQACLYTLPCHSSLVSHVRFATSGDHFITTSFDSTAKLWSYPGYLPLRTLSDHESRVMCCDITRDGRFFVTASYDRTFKLWAAE